MDQLIRQIGRIVQQIDLLSAIVDILILVLLIYGLLSILRGTRAEILVRGLIILFGLAFIVVNIVQLPVLKWVVTNSLQFIIFAIIVIFAPELRRTLEQIGHTSDFINRPLGQRTNDVLRATIEEVITTAFYLSNQRWGGLIVIERETGLQDLANRGVPINGQVSTQLLSNIFVPNTPLHDGAVIIRGDQIVAAKVILPLADISSRAEQHGTRHKAALGISEQSDAIIVVVSEETGNVSLAHSGKLITKLDRERLRYNLRTLLEPAPGLGLGRRNGRRKPLTTSAKVQEVQAKIVKSTLKEDAAPKPARTVKDTLTQKENRPVREETAPLKGGSPKEPASANGGSVNVNSVNVSKETVPPNGNGAFNKEISKEAATPNGNSNGNGNGSLSKEPVPSNSAPDGNKDAALPGSNGGNGEASPGANLGQKDAKARQDEQAPVVRSDKR
jgi:diadenylate cyclase